MTEERNYGIYNTYNRILVSLKRKEILPCETTWMNLENVLLSEIRWSQDNKYCMITFIHEASKIN